MSDGPEVLLHDPIYGSADWSTDRTLEQRIIKPGTPMRINDPLLVEERGDEFRHTTCERQRACLDIAVRAKWKGYACFGCEFAPSNLPEPP